MSVCNCMVAKKCALYIARMCMIGITLSLFEILINVLIKVLYLVLYGQPSPLGPR